jgi:hypothetical protein
VKNALTLGHLQVYEEHYDHDFEPFVSLHDALDSFIQDPPSESVLCDPEYLTNRKNQIYKNLSEEKQKTAKILDKIHKIADNK